MSSCNSPLILFLPDEGQLAHRLSRIAQIMAQVHHRRGLLLCPCFDEYINLFPAYKNYLCFWYLGDQPHRYSNQLKALFGLFILFLGELATETFVKKFRHNCDALANNDLEAALTCNDQELRVLFKYFALKLVDILPRHAELRGPERLVSVGHVESHSGSHSTSFDDAHIAALWSEKDVLLWANEDYTTSREFQENFIPELRAIVRPSSCDLEDAQRRVDLARQNAEIVIGMHMRLGDYRVWHDGKYFYSEEEYLSIMKRLTALFPNKKISFLIASNERQSSTFAPPNTYFAPGGILSDLIALSLCDYVVGPPSGFNRLASLLGNTPRWNIESAQQDFRLSDAMPYLSFS